MNQKTAIDLLTEALALAQQEFKPVLKTSWNPNTSSHFADLATVIAATQPALAKHGLVVMQTVTTNMQEKTVTVTTQLVHRSGQTYSNDLTLPATMMGKNEWVNNVKTAGPLRFDVQSIGAAITYGRRYSYQAMVGVVGEPDEDGETEKGDEEERGSTQAQQAVATRKLTEAGVKTNGGKPQEEKKPEIELIPGADGMTYLRGLKGIPIVRANGGKLITCMAWMDHHQPPMWAIPDDQVDAFSKHCAKLNVEILRPARTPEAANA